MTVFDNKQELMQAKSNETLLKESFFTNLNDKNKIDSYEITL